MKEGRTLPVIQPVPDAGVSRRAALQTFAAGLGASLAVPGLADGSDHPVHKHTAQVAEQAKKAAGTATAYKPVTFDAHQYATVAVLSELIVPGARAAGTPEFLDKLLAVESAETRRRFISALGAFEGAAITAHKKGFKDLTAGEQVAILTQAAGAQPGRVVLFWKKGDPIPLPEVPSGPATLRDHFDHLKGWVAGIYFASAAGLKELGYTGNVFHETYPGCAHTGPHV